MRVFAFPFVHIYRLIYSNHLLYVNVKLMVYGSVWRDNQKQSEKFCSLMFRFPLELVKRVGSRVKFLMYLHFYVCVCVCCKTEKHPEPHVDRSSSVVIFSSGFVSFGDLWGFFCTIVHKYFHKNDVCQQFSAFRLTTLWVTPGWHDAKWEDGDNNLSMALSKISNMNNIYIEFPISRPRQGLFIGGFTTLFPFFHYW